MEITRINDLLIKKKHNIVVIDDEPQLLSFIGLLLTKFLPQCNIKMCQYFTDEFYNHIYKNDIGLCIMDVIIGRENAQHVSKDIIELKDDMIFLFISGYDYSFDSFSFLKGKCLYDYMSKPFSDESFLGSIISLLNISTTYKLLKQEKESLDKVRKYYLNLIKKDKLMIKNFKNECKKQKINNIECKTI